MEPLEAWIGKKKIGQREVVLSVGFIYFLPNPII